MLLWSSDCASVASVACPRTAPSVVPPHNRPVVAATLTRIRRSFEPILFDICREMGKVEEGQSQPAWRVINNEPGHLSLSSAWQYSLSHEFENYDSTEIGQTSRSLDPSLQVFIWVHSREIGKQGFIWSSKSLRFAALAHE